MTAEGDVQEMAAPPVWVGPGPVGSLAASSAAQKTALAQIQPEFASRPLSLCGFFRASLKQLPIRDQQAELLQAIYMKYVLL